MSKTGKGSIVFEYSDGEMVEATLWKCDNENTFSVSIDDPWDGFKSSKDVERLGKQLVRWAERMKKAGQ